MALAQDDRATATTKPVVAKERQRELKDYKSQPRRGPSNSQQEARGRILRSSSSTPSRSVSTEKGQKNPMPTSEDISLLEHEGEIGENKTNDSPEQTEKRTDQVEEENAMETEQPMENIFQKLKRMKGLIEAIISPKSNKESMTLLARQAEQVRREIKLTYRQEREEILTGMDQTKKTVAFLEEENEKLSIARREERVTREQEGRKMAQALNEERKKNDDMTEGNLYAQILKRVTNIENKIEKSSEKQLNQTAAPPKYNESMPSYSYSEALQSKVMVIRTQNSTSTQAITKKLQAVKNAPNIRQMIPKENNIVIKADNEGDLDKIKEILDEMVEENFDVEKKGPNMKKLILYNVKKEHNPLLTEKRIREKFNLRPHLVRHVSKFQSNTQPLAEHVIVSIATPIANEILGHRKIWLGFKGYHVAKYSEVTQCRKCCDFGHIATKCRKQTACAKCAGPHHSKDCESQEFHCRNCLKWNDYKAAANHPSYAKSCPVYRNALEDEKWNDTQNN